MDVSFQHLNVGRGLDILLAKSDVLTGSPQAVIHIQPDDTENAVDIGDIAVAIRLSAARLRTLLGNAPMADSLLSGGVGE